MARTRAKGGLLPHRAVLVAVGAVRRATDEAVALALAVEDFRQRPHDRGRYVRAEPGGGATGNLDLPCLRVEARCGVVTLSGPVPTAAAREAAARAARRVPGVRAVLDRMEVERVLP